MTLAISAAGEKFVHRADAVHEFLHDVHGEERILLDETLEAARVHFREFAGRHGQDGGAARSVIHQRHLAENGAALGIFYDLVADEHVERAFEHDEHAVGGIAGPK